MFDRVMNMPLRYSTPLPSPKIEIVFSKSKGISFRKEQLNLKIPSECFFRFFESEMYIKKM